MLPVISGEPGRNSGKNLQQNLDFPRVDEKIANASHGVNRKALALSQGKKGGSRWATDYLLDLPEGMWQAIFWFQAILAHGPNLSHMIEEFRGT
ncbi:MAG: hypothetical protein JRJ12_11650 [Deltaproteobacteria bacterium]|nr:hypothetical protein [Deltaproteobacteria bacterium]